MPRRVGPFAMDKICRGSAIGDALCSGSWAGIGSTVDTSHRRGTEICTTSFKLENTAPTKLSKARSTASDTFRSQEWFRHDLGRPTELPQREVALGNSPRPWKDDGFAGSPSSPRGLQNGVTRSKSQKSFGEMESSSDRAAGTPRRGVERSRSVGLLGQQSGPRDVTVSLFDGKGAARNPRSPRSPRGGFAVDVPAGRPVERGRSCDNGVDSAPRKRTQSPTYQQSENWMAFSSGQKEPPARDNNPTMPSQGFNYKSRLAHVGRQSEGNDNILGRGRGDHVADPGPPEPSGIFAADCVASRGKKMMNPKMQTHDAARRIKQDSTEPALLASERKHAFPELPQSHTQMEEFKLSPRLPPPQSTANFSSAANGCIADVMHRTSAEMASAMMPERVTADATEEQRKYMVGREVVSWANCGRRGAQQCFLNTRRVASQISKEAGGSQIPPPHSLANVRDHRNSDVLWDHMRTGPAPKWQEKLTVAPNMMPVQPSPARKASAPSTAAGLQNGVLSYGDVSCLPNSTPKDHAYLQSGLKVFKYGARTPGYFSPLMPHAQIAHEA